MTTLKALLLRSKLCDSFMSDLVCFHNKKHSSFAKNCNYARRATQYGAADSTAVLRATRNLFVCFKEEALSTKNIFEVYSFGKLKQDNFHKFYKQTLFICTTTISTDRDKMIYQTS